MYPIYHRRPGKKNGKGEKMYLATYNQGFLLFSNIRYWEENLEKLICCTLKPQCKQFFAILSRLVEIICAPS